MVEEDVEKRWTALAGVGRLGGMWKERVVVHTVSSGSRRQAVDRMINAHF